MDATAIQKALVSRGYDIAVDGTMGPQTLAAILARAGLHADRAPFVALASGLLPWLGLGAINSPLRLRHFLAQSAVETWAFTTLREKSDGTGDAYFARYDGNKALGNTQPGDGARFKGRGFLDLTGRGNYTACARRTGLDCVAHPELLEQPGPGAQSAMDFWSSRPACNQRADADDIEGVTRAVNGGLNGLADRQTYYARLSVLAPL